MGIRTLQKQPQGQPQSESQLRVAVVGAGMAGAACAHGLMQAGHAVQVFDKSRGPGGRMATRVMPWVDAHGTPAQQQFFHGVAGFAARSPAFQSHLRAAELAGHVRAWQPVVDPKGWPVGAANLHHQPVPDMAQLCRELLAGAQQLWHHPVQALQHGAAGWQLRVDNHWHTGHFDAVVLALPPAQAAVLLTPHHREWAQRASLALMQPCWTLMGVAQALVAPVPWQVSQPTRGPVAWLSCADAGPGHQAWVAHARPAWSRAHLEQAPAWVQTQLQQAVADWLGQAPPWRCAVVHRWRYAMPHAMPHTLPRTLPQALQTAAVATPSSACWWDGRLGLGVCGDFLGGHGANGVEGAWLSGRALALSLLASVDTGLGLAHG
jgi:renalase